MRTQKTNSSEYTLFKSILSSNDQGSEIKFSYLQLYVASNRELISEVDESGKTLLYYAVFHRKMESAEALINAGANVNAIAASGKSILLCAMFNHDEEMIHLLIDNGAVAHFFHENYAGHSEISNAIAYSNKHSSSIFSLLLSSRDKLLQELYDHGLAENFVQMRDALNQFYRNISGLLLPGQINKSIMVDFVFIRLFNQRKFKSASVIYENRDKISVQMSDRKLYEEDFAFFREKNYVFIENGTQEQNTSITLFFKKLYSLLENRHYCINLLHELDEKLASAFPEFGSINPGKGILVANDFRFPSRPDENHQFIKTNSVLTHFIFDKLRQFGVCISDEVLTFVGFVASDVANQKVQEGFVFKDHWALNQGILHGKYTHLLHFYLIARMIECGDLKLPEGCNLINMMTWMVNTKLDNGTLWARLIDKALNYEVFADVSKLSFGYVHHFNAALWFCDALPHLRGCLLNSFYKSMYKLQNMIEHKFSVRPDYELIAYALSASFSNFNLLDTGIEKQDVKSRLQIKNPSAVFDIETGIIRKKLPTLFQPAVQSVLETADVQFGL